MEHDDSGPEKDRLDAGLHAAFEPSSQGQADSILARLEIKAGALPRVLLADLPEDASPVVSPAGPVAAPLPTAMGSYQVIGEIARGGVGIVLKGRDTDLGRDVAIKLLKPGLDQDPGMVQRFVEEAQIGGQLTHPGIVPIYGLGIEADRRPYFAMKLVKGETLAEILTRRRDPEEDRRRCLGIFEQICHTVAYAHARRVIHRDLKPANVLVGAFGEVQVVDWGFAKVLTRGSAAEVPPEPAESVIRTVRTDSGGSESRVGSVMGTPAYMPPEQARGEVASMDARSDVFALGGILAEILTGEPTYSDGDPSPVVQALRAELGGAYDRLERCGADSELVALARECLAERPGERPRDGSALAARVSGYLSSVEERARAAELAAETARVKAEEERKKRRLSIALAASVVLLFVLAGGGTWWVESRRQERVRDTTERVTAELEEVKRLAGAAEASGPGDVEAWESALAAARKAAEIMEGGEPDDTTRERVAQAIAEAEAGVAAARLAFAAAERDRAVVARLEEVRLRERHESRAPEILSGFQAAFRDYGLDVMEMGVEEAAREISGTAIRSELAVALDGWAQVETGYGTADRAGRLRRIARLADDDPWRNRLRDAVITGDVDELVVLATDHLEQYLQGNAAHLLAAQLDAAGKRALAIKVLFEGQRLRPHGFWSNTHLCWLLTEARRYREAVEYGRAALAVRPESPLVVGQIARAQLGAGRFREAIDSYKLAIEMAPSAEDYPDFRIGLGRIYSDLGQFERAREEFRLAAESPHRAALAIASAADAYLEEGRTEEAIAKCREALEKDEDYPFAHRLLGKAHLHLAQYEDALPHLERGHYETEAGVPSGVEREIGQCRRLMALAPRTEALLERREEPADLDERIDFSRFCVWSGHHLEAARHAGIAADTDPGRVPGLRFDAACYAALASVADGLEPSEREAWRARALGYLQTQLDINERRLFENPGIRGRIRWAMLLWRRDPQLRAVRDADSLRAFPDAERREWETLWKDAGALLTRTRE